MICPRCLLRTTSRSTRQTSQLQSRRAQRDWNNQFSRCFTTTPSRSANDSQTLTPSATQHSTPSRSPPAATSTSAAQPFSTPRTPSPKSAGTPSSPSSTPQTSKEPQRSKVVSSVAGGQILKGLNYFRNKTDPVAMEDHEYPDWLWEVLTEKKKARQFLGTGKEEMDPRLFSKSARARQVARKKQRKLATMDPESIRPSVPIYEQSIDLPSGDGTSEGDLRAEESRNELTSAMRAKRRKDIKEKNFLQSFR